MLITIVGYGSIGKKHCKVLVELGQDVNIVTRQTVPSFKTFLDLEDAIKLKPDLIIVSNKTSDHAKTLIKLNYLKYEGIVLVEKPISMNIENLSSQDFSFKSLVAYNMRFHPLLQKMKRLIKDEKVLSVNAYVGQYLPDWRPDTIYSDSYSAKKAEGGGVLRDLSHELDFLSWLFGEFNNSHSKVGKISNLEITSEDCCHILCSQSNSIMTSISLNYLDRISARNLRVITEQDTYYLDFITQTLVSTKTKIKEDYSKLITYQEMHKRIIEGDLDDFCSLSHGEYIVKVIQELESQWID